jgi:hypothetical protein
MWIIFTKKPNPANSLGKIAYVRAKIVVVAEKKNGANGRARTETKKQYHLRNYNFVVLLNNWVNVHHSPSTQF